MNGAYHNPSSPVSDHNVWHYHNLAKWTGTDFGDGAVVNACPFSLLPFRFYESGPDWVNEAGYTQDVAKFFHISTFIDSMQCFCVHCDKPASECAEWSVHCNCTTTNTAKQKLAEQQLQLQPHSLHQAEPAFFIPLHQADPLLSIALDSPYERVDSQQHTASCKNHSAADGYVLFGGEPLSSDSFSDCPAWRCASDALPATAFCNSTTAVPCATGVYSALGNSMLADSGQGHCSATSTSNLLVSRRCADPTTLWQLSGAGHATRSTDGLKYSHTTQQGNSKVLHSFLLLDFQPCKLFLCHDVECTVAI